MTNDQQNLVETGKKKNRPGTFQPGNDPRRNLKGRGKLPANAKELNTLIDEILAQEVKNPNTGEMVTRLRLLLRSMTTSKQSAEKIHILDRRFGKVAQAVDVTGELTIKQKAYIGFSPDDWDKADGQK